MDQEDRLHKSRRGKVPIEPPMGQILTYWRPLPEVSPDEDFRREVETSITNYVILVVRVINIRCTAILSLTSVCSLRLDFGVEADELLVVQSSVAVQVVAPNHVDGLVDAEAKLALQHRMSFLDRYNSVTVTVELHEFTSNFSAPSTGNTPTYNQCYRILNKQIHKISYPTLQN